MAGFWNQSQSQLYDQNGKPLVGARAYFYLGGTTTPITVYKAFSLGAINAHPNPLTTDGWGRWPSVYLDEADQFFRVRVTTASGVMIYDIDGIPIIGPAESGGGGGDNPVDPDAVLQTGDMMWRYNDGFRAGFVRANGRTIGSATSGATERANADVQALFELLWNMNLLPVVGGRGATAAADWAANKQMTLPDARARALVGTDTMGNIAANIISVANYVGWNGGEANHTLSINELPAHNHTGDTDGGGLHAHQTPASSGSGSGVSLLTDTAAPGALATTTDGFHGHHFTTNTTGGGLAHNNVQPSLAATLYIKL